MDEKLKSLYDNMVKGGYKLPPFEQFSTDMGDSTKAQRLHSTLINDGYRLPADFKQFYSDIKQPKINQQNTQQPEQNVEQPNLFKQYEGMLNRGFYKPIISDLPKVMGAAAEKIGRTIGDEHPSIFSKIGEATGRWIDEKNPVSPEVEGSISGQVTSGIGQVLGMVSTMGFGGAGAVAEKGAPLAVRGATALGNLITRPTAIIGGAMTAAPEFEAAKAAGKSDDEAFNTLVKNYFVGQTEAIPVEGMFNSLNRITGGGIVKNLKQYAAGVIKGGLSEATQEGVQTYLTNKIAAGDYDPDRDPLWGIADAMTVGGLVGMIIPGVGGAIKSASPENKAKLERKVQELQAKDAALKQVDASLAENTTGNPATDAAIDDNSKLSPDQFKVVQDTKLVNAEEESAQADQEQKEKQAQETATLNKDADQANKEEQDKQDRIAELKTKIAEINQKSEKGEALPESLKDLKAELADLTEPKTKVFVYGTLTDPTTRKEALGEHVNSEAHTLDGLTKEDGEYSTIRQAEGGEVHGQMLELNKDQLAKLDSWESQYERKEVKPGIFAYIRKAGVDTQGVNTQEFNNAADKVRALQARFAQANPADDLTQLYEQLKEAQHALRQVAPQSRVGGKSQVKINIENSTGVTQQGKTVRMTPAQAIKHQVQTFYRGVSEGVKRGAELKNQLVAKVQEALKGSPLTNRQSGALLNKVKKTNLFTLGSVSKLNAFIDKVSTDAQYAEKLGQAEEHRSALKGKSKPSKNIPVNHTTLARQFSKIVPSEVEDLDKYNEMATKLRGNFAAVDSKGYNATSNEEVENYTEEQLDKQDTDQEEVSQKEFKDKDLNELRELATGVEETLNYHDTSGYDESENQVIENIKKININELSAEGLQNYIRIVNNITENSNFSNVDYIDNIAKTQKFVNEFSDKTKNLEKGIVGGWGKFMYNVSQTLKRIFNNTALEGEFRRRSGLGDLIQAKANTEKATTEAVHKIDELRKKLKKETGKDIFDDNNQTQLGVFSLLYQGDEQDRQKIHANIVQTINRLRAAGQEEEAKRVANAYSVFEAARTAEEVKQVMDDKNPLIYEAWELFGGEKGIFNETLRQQHQKVSEEVHNREYTDVENYTPITQRSLSTLKNNAEDVAATKTTIASGKPKAVQSNTAKRRTLRLDRGRVYSFNPYNDFIKKYGETVYDIEASRPANQLRTLLEHPEFINMVGGQDNAETLAAQYSALASIQRGDSFASDEASKFLTELGKTFRSIGVARSLGSVSQLFKQTVSTMVKTTSNLLATGDMNQLVPAIHAVAEMDKSTVNGEESPVKKLLDATTIKVRNLRLGSTDRGDSDIYTITPGVKKTALSMLERARFFTDKRIRGSLGFLRTGDVKAAQTSFLAYYLRSLKQQGVTDVDLNTEYKRVNEKERKQAIAEAESLVEQTQTASVASAHSKLQRQALGNSKDAWNFVKNVFLPFSMFDSDFKARLVNEFISAKRAPSAKNTIEFMGTMGEAATFAAFSAFVMVGYKEAIKAGLRGLTGTEPPDKSEEQKQKAKEMSFWTSFTNAINPLALGSIPQEIQQRAINQVVYIASNEKGTYADWKKKHGAVVYDPFDKPLIEQLGVFSSGISPFIESAKTVPKLAQSVLLGQPVEMTDSYGHSKKVYLTHEQQNVLALKSMVEMLSTIGINEADVFNAARDIYRETSADAAKHGRTHAPAK